MPIIDVMFSKGSLDDAKKQKLAERLSDILMEIEGTKDNPQFAAGTWLTLHENDVQYFAVGGRVAAYPAIYRIIVHLPEKTMQLAVKEQIVQRMTDAVLEIEGSPLDARQRGRVYCLINEIADGGWGFAGQVYTLERLRALRA